MPSPHDKCHQCGLLTEELRVSKSQCEDLEGLRHQLEEQVIALQSHQDQFETQEKDLNSEIKCLQEQLNQALITSRTLDSCVPSVTKIDTMPDLPLVTVVPEQTQVPDSDGSESHVATDCTVSGQEALEQCQSRLMVLEKENKLLQVCILQIHSFIVLSVMIICYDILTLILYFKWYSSFWYI